MNVYNISINIQLPVELGSVSVSLGICLYTYSQEKFYMYTCFQANENEK